MSGLYFVDHLLDRQRVTFISILIIGGPPEIKRIGAVEPVETQARVVKEFLLRQQQDKAPPVGKRAPSGFVIVIRRALRASV